MLENIFSEKTTKQSKYWCLVWNNYPPDHLQKLGSLPAATYRIISYEHAPTTGTPHLHVYIEFRKLTRFETLQRLNLFSDIQSRKGTSKQASDYCKDKLKPGPSENYVEEGILSVSTQGKRNDLNNACEIIKQFGVDGLIEENPGIYVKHHRGFESLAFKLNARQPKIIPEVIVYWGDTGTGKTHSVMEQSPNCFLSSNCKWYDGWDGERDICFEEFSGGITINNFLRLIDRYPVTVETKGGTINFNPKRVFITSHYHPSKWYADSERFQELWRRITVCQHYMSVRGDDPNVSVTEVAGNTSQPLLKRKYVRISVPADPLNLGPDKMDTIQFNKFSPQ